MVNNKATKFNKACLQIQIFVGITGAVAKALLQRIDASRTYPADLKHSATGRRQMLLHRPVTKPVELVKSRFIGAEASG